MADDTSKTPGRVMLSPQLLKLGMMLDFTLYDESGRMLLARRHRIDNQHLLDLLQQKKALYADQDESREPIKVLMSSFTQATLRDAPLKDLDKFNTLRGVERPPEREETLPQAWSDLESRLRAALGNLPAGGAVATEALRRTESVVDRVMQLAHADSDGSLFLLVNRAVTGFTGYSTLHGLLCAALAVHVGPECGLDAAETSALLHAALTMNVAVKGLQDTMAAQKLPPTQEQLHEIDRHPAAAVRVLAAAGVDNPIWLGAVDLHHETLSPGLPLAHMAPAERVAKVLQVIDRYTAALSPRGSRAGRNAREATRSVVRVPGTADHDEVGLALLQRLGLFPPGTYVKLASGETAVVLLRGSRTNEPHVASVLNRRDEPVAVPRPLNTGVPEHAVTQGLSGSDMRVRLNEGHMLGLMAVLRANIERGNATP